MRRLRILVSAYACRPDRGSEPGVGWNFARHLLKYHDVWVLTRTENKPFIESALPAPRGLNFVYYSPTGSISLGDRKWSVELQYYSWQLGVYRFAKRLHREIGFDFVHHVTYARYWMPSLLARLPVPFVWGPVGGGESAPPALFTGLRYRDAGFEMLRNLARKCGELDPLTRMTAREAVLTFASTPQTYSRLSRMCSGPVHIRSQNALSVEDIELLSAAPALEGSPFRFVSIGQLLHWKGFHLGLQAFAQLDAPDSEYWIIGDGPARKHLEKLAARLGISDRVRFWGDCSRTKTLTLLLACSALVHPSLHDSGGLVCLEAMAAKRPVICLELGGPAMYVTEDTGAVVRADNVEQIVRDLRDVMKRLIVEPGVARAWGEQAAERVREHFNWDIEARAIAGHYHDILATNSYTQVDSSPALSQEVST